LSRWWISLLVREIMPSGGGCNTTTGELAYGTLRGLG
jgi:hypothetical protein